MNHIQLNVLRATKDRLATKKNILFVKTESLIETATEKIEN